jgi:hypothetical protein
MRGAKIKIKNKIVDLFISLLYFNGYMFRSFFGHHLGILRKLNVHYEGKVQPRTGHEGSNVE